MRRIKFRVWDNWNKVYVDKEKYIIDFLGNVFRVEGREIVTYENYEQMTIEQYTGLKDCNGVEIYEGDKVKCCDGIEKDGSAACWVETIKSIFDIYDIGHFIVEVVGNIHE